MHSLDAHTANLILCQGQVPELIFDVLKNRTAEKLEWGITYLLLKDREGFVSKELIRGMFDGSIFETMAKKVEAQKMQKKKM